MKIGKFDGNMVDFNVFAQNLDCGYAEAVLTSTHNLCFGTKIGMPLQSPVVFFLYKSGV